MNEWLSESINISAFSNVTLCVSFTNSGTMELNTSTGACNNADDIIQGQYRINGGPWISWFFDDGGVNLSPATVSGLSGTTVEMRILLGNKANDEFYTFDDICVTGTPVALPVELTLFEAKAYGQSQALLSWSTATETGNDYFVVEKTTDGISWQKVGQIDGHGTSTQPHQYSLVDPGPVTAVTYYRLKQVDFNGQYAYSGLRMVMPEETNQLSLYPNPAGDYFTVSGLTAGQPATISVYDCTGNLVQMIVSAETQETISTGQLAAGIYFVTVVSGERTVSFKLICSQRN